MARLNAVVVKSQAALPLAVPRRGRGPTLPTPEEMLYWQKGNENTRRRVWKARLSRSVAKALSSVEQAVTKAQLGTLQRALDRRNALDPPGPLLTLSMYYHHTLFTYDDIEGDPFRTLLGRLINSRHTSLVLDLCGGRDTTVALHLACGVCSVVCDDVWKACRSVPLGK